MDSISHQPVQSTSQSIHPLPLTHQPPQPVLSKVQPVLTKAIDPVVSSKDDDDNDADDNDDDTNDDNVAESSSSSSLLQPHPDRAFNSYEQILDFPKQWESDHGFAV